MKSYVQYIARDVRWYIIQYHSHTYHMTAAVYLSVVTQKLRLRLRMCVAHVSYIYLIHTYINIYNDMYGMLGPPARRGFCWFLPLEP